MRNYVVMVIKICAGRTIGVCSLALSSGKSVKWPSRSIKRLMEKARTAPAGEIATLV
jgi:hypothetical protein